MTEEWLPIAGFPSYEVSSLGNVRSLTRTVPGPYGSTRVMRGKQLVAFVCKQTGYKQVMLSDRKKYNVHRLVAEAFIPNTERKPQVNHKNGIRSDANAENLEWVTASENIRHAFSVLKRRNPFIGAFGGNHPTSKCVIARSIADGSESIFASAMDAVRVGFDSSCISRCANGAARQHKGHTWRFAEPA